MFEQILKDPKAVTRHQNGPQVEERRRGHYNCAKVPVLFSCRPYSSAATIHVKAIRFQTRPILLAGELSWTNTNVSPI